MENNGKVDIYIPALIIGENSQGFDSTVHVATSPLATDYHKSMRANLLYSVLPCVWQTLGKKSQAVVSGQDMMGVKGSIPMAIMDNR